MRVYYLCGTARGEVEVSDSDWHKGIVKTTCPVCGSELHQKDGCFNIVPLSTGTEKGEEA